MSISRVRPTERKQKAERNWAGFRKRMKNPRFYLMVIPALFVLLPYSILFALLKAGYEWFHFNISNTLVNVLRRGDRWIRDMWRDMLLYLNDTDKE